MKETLNLIGFFFSDIVSFERRTKRNETEEAISLYAQKILQMVAGSHVWICVRYTQLFQTLSEPSVTLRVYKGRQNSIGKSESGYSSNLIQNLSIKRINSHFALSGIAVLADTCGEAVISGFGSDQNTNAVCGKEKRPRIYLPYSRRIFLSPTENDILQHGIKERAAGEIAKQ